MWELLAKLGGELRKDAAETARGVSLIILNNQGRGQLDPEGDGEGRFILVRDGAVAP